MIDTKFLPGWRRLMADGADTFLSTNHITIVLFRDSIVGEKVSAPSIVSIFFSSSFFDGFMIFGSVSNLVRLNAGATFPSSAREYDSYFFEAPPTPSCFFIFIYFSKSMLGVKCFSASPPITSRAVFFDGYDPALRADRSSVFMVNIKKGMNIRGVSSLPIGVSPDVPNRLTFSPVSPLVVSGGNGCRSPATTMAKT